MAVLVMLAAAAATTLAGAASARPDARGFTTTPAMVRGLIPGVEVKPIISVGDKVGGYMFESIPDGVAVNRVSKNRVHLYVNHETSTVPFPPTQSDFTNAMMSRLVMDGNGDQIVSGEYVIPSMANFHRFCSNFLVTREHGFSRGIILTSEEATDRVNRTGVSWPAGPNAEQAGVVVAYDTTSGKYRAVYSMGRLNHENAVAIPGYKNPVILSGDDTFSAPSSQMYMYLTKGANAIMRDEGALYAFKSDNPAHNDYGDLAFGRGTTGQFIRVPVSVALGDQTALENWSNENGVFQFIRIEDIAYDRNHTNIVYFADTGEPRAIPDPKTGRLMRGPSGTKGPYPNGRIFKMVLDRKNPLRVNSLTVLIDGDVRGAAGAGDVSLIHNPDNIETTKKALIIQEDPGSHNNYAADDPKGVNARIWRYDFKSLQVEPVAEVVQTLDPKASKGNWESSGIVDAAPVHGAGWFYLTVQAHSVWVTQEQRGSITFKREGGQLALIRLPGTY